MARSSTGWNTSPTSSTWHDRTRSKVYRPTSLATWRPLCEELFSTVRATYVSRSAPPQQQLYIRSRSPHGPVRATVNRTCLFVFGLVVVGLGQPVRVLAADRLEIVRLESERLEDR